MNVDEFVAKHGFTNCDAGDRMKADLVEMMPKVDPSYHDLHITTKTMKRTSIFNLPFGYELSCTRVSGWRLYGPTKTQAQQGIGPFPVMNLHTGPTLIAGEYEGRGKGMIVDVAGHVIVDSLTVKEEGDEQT